MTREEHLAFCNRCLNRKFDPGKGVVCGLTGAVAAFENECPDFRVDASVSETRREQIELTPEEVKGKVSTDTYERLRLDQNLVGGILAGSAAALIGASVWAMITVATNYQIGYMAILVGAVVGFSVRTIGKGLDILFSVVGALIALLGCVVGNFLSVIGYIANANDLGYMDTLFSFDYSLLGEVMSATFDVRDLLFYGIAAYTGFKLSRRSLSEKEARALDQRR